MPTFMCKHLIKKILIITFKQTLIYLIIDEHRRKEENITVKKLILNIAMYSLCLSLPFNKKQSILQRQ